MANINIDGNVDYWYEGEGSTSIGQVEEDIGTQDYWFMGAPTGYLPASEVDFNQPFSFAVMIGF